MRTPRAVLAALAVAVAAGGCAGARPTARTPLEIADDLFARGDHRGAAEAYAAAAAHSKVQGDADRARFFHLLADRAASGPDDFDALLDAFRALSVEASGTRWGRLAGLYADEMSQANSLRWALQRAGADVVALLSKLTELDASLAAKEQLTAEQAAQLQAMKDERAQLQRSLHDLEEQLAARGAALDEVKAELDALKRIDLSRVP